MNVLIFGGTGLLGSAAAQIFVDRGHSVKTVASPHIPKGARLPEEMQIIYGNFLQMSDVELEHLMSEALTREQNFRLRCTMRTKNII